MSRARSVKREREGVVEGVVGNERVWVTKFNSTHTKEIDTLSSSPATSGKITTYLSISHITKKS